MDTRYFLITIILGRKKPENAFRLISAELIVTVAKLVDPSWFGTIFYKPERQLSRLARNDITTPVSNFHYESTIKQFSRQHHACESRNSVPRSDAYTKQ